MPTKKTDTPQPQNRTRQSNAKKEEPNQNGTGTRPAVDKPRAQNPGRSRKGAQAVQQGVSGTQPKAKPAEGVQQRGAGNAQPNQGASKVTRRSAAMREKLNTARQQEKVAPARSQAERGMQPQPQARSIMQVQRKHMPAVSASFQMVGAKPKISPATEHPARSTLRMIPLGGMGEIGKNMTAYEYGNDIIIVDVGQSFPDESMPGVDAVIPDFSYVMQNRDRVRGIFITHGHEDHIGALPYLLKDLQVPVYGGRLTIELIKYKLENHMSGLLKSSKLITVKDGDVIPCGVFSVEFIHVNHSIADASMLAIKTPVGYVMHSGDFKIDYTPIDGGIMDLQRIAAIGQEGVLLFVCESTNIEVRGHSVSEKQVGESFASMFAGAKGRIFIATFSSNVHRLQQIFSAAEKHGRKVALAGRSMLNVFNAANSLGYIQYDKTTLIDLSHIDDYQPNQVVILSTGSQGEPMSALTRIAFSSHREVEIVPGDTVIISASPIPGNEKPVYKVINELYKRGAKVFYSAITSVHASGHATQDEIKLVHTLVNPKYLVPAHGEYRMLYQHAEMAHRLGQPWEDIFLLSNGDIFEITKKSARIAGFTNGDAVLIDGSSLGDVDNAVLRERKLLSGDGVVSVSIVLGKKTGELIAPPVVQALGFLYQGEYEQIIGDCERRAVAFVIRVKSQHRNVAEAIRGGQLRDQIRNFLYEKTRRRPVVMVTLSEV